MIVGVILPHSIIILICLFRNLTQTSQLDQDISLSWLNCAQYYIIMINKQAHHYKISPDKLDVLPGSQPSMINYGPFGQSPTGLKLKINQTQNKSKFFEGQLDGLISSNMQMKEQLSQAQRMLLNSTQMLRNLLPEPSLPERKLALQLANIEGVSELIKQDWHNMEDSIRDMQAHLQQKNNKIHNMQLQNLALIKSHESQMQNMIESHRKEMSDSQQKYNTKQQQLQSQIELLKVKLGESVSLLQFRTEKMKAMEQKYRTLITEHTNTISQQQRTIQRLEDEQSQLTLEFELSKKLLIEHYQLQFAQKQEDIKNSYELLLKMKGEQHAKSIQEITEYVNAINMKLQSSEKRINELNQWVTQAEAEKKQLELERRRVQGQLLTRNAAIEELTSQLESKAKAIKQLQASNDLSRLEASSVQEKLAAAIARYAQREQEITLERSKREEQIAAEMTRIGRQLQQQQVRGLKYIQERNQKQHQIRQLQRQFQDAVKEIEQFKTLKQECSNLTKLIERYKLVESQHQRIVESYQTQLASKIEELSRAQSSHEDAIKKLIQNHKLQNKKIEKQALRKLKQVQQSQSQYISKLMREQSQRLSKQQAEIISLQQAHQSQLSNLEERIRKINESAALLQKELAMANKRHQSQIATLQQQHAEALQQQAHDHSAQLNRMQIMLKQQELHFASQLEDKQQEYSRNLRDKQQQFNSKIEGLEKNISQLKSSSAVMEVENKYLAMIDRLKGEASRDKQALMMKQAKQLAAFKDRLQKELTQHEKAHLRHVQRLQSQFNRELKSISQNLSSNIATLNDELLGQKQAHEFTKMSRQQKIVNLTEKILAIRKERELKNQRILQLEYEIDKKIKQMQEIDELVNEKLRKKKQQYDLYLQQTQRSCRKLVKEKTDECNLRVKEVEIERVKFTEKLYLEFQEMKSNFQRQIGSQIKKYDELEKLFQERPSRQQDVNKIKQLTLIKQKMDIEVKEFKKKIMGANEIVKYLNLQLENYKEVYDIFGPQGFDSEVAQSKQEELEGYVRGSMSYLTDSSFSKREAPKEENSNEKILRVRKYVRQRNARVRTEMSTIQQKAEPEKKIDFSQGADSEGINQQAYQTLRQVREQKEQLKQTNLIFKRQRHRRVGSLNKINEGSDGNKKLVYDERDTTKQLRSNAEIFLSMVSINQKPVAEIRKANPGYGKMSKRRAFNSMNKERAGQKQKQKKYQIRDRILTLQR